MSGQKEIREDQIAQYASAHPNKVALINSHVLLFRLMAMPLVISRHCQFPQQPMSYIFIYLSNLPILIALIGRLCWLGRLLSVHDLLVS